MRIPVIATGPRRLVALPALAVSTGLTILVASAALSSAAKPMKPLSREEVAQAWVGLSEDELYILRVDLRQDGTGAGAYAFAQQEPQMFHVSSWQYDGEHIELVTLPVPDSVIASDRIEGRLQGVAMELTLKGRGWELRVHLRQEADLERRWERLRRHMNVDASMLREEVQAEP